MSPTGVFTRPNHPPAPTGPLRAPRRRWGAALPRGEGVRCASRSLRFAIRPVWSAAPRLALSQPRGPLGDTNVARAVASSSSTVVCTHVDRHWRRTGGPASACAGRWSRPADRLTLRPTHQPTHRPTSAPTGAGPNWSGSSLTDSDWLWLTDCLTG
eukprot:36901-Prorocentrum_minimum.AAC.1